jgi:hypothetical protein
LAFNTLIEALLVLQNVSMATSDELAANDLHHVETNVERRVQVAFSVSPDKVQAFLPSSRVVASMPSGPSSGANLLIAFRNRLQTVYYDDDRKPQLGEQDRGLVMLAVARQVEDGELGLWVVRSLAANPSSVPGPYGNSRQVAVHVKQRLAFGEGVGGAGVESWTVRDEAGRSLVMYLSYRVGVPVQSTTSTSAQ